MNPYLEFVAGFTRQIQAGRRLPLGGLTPAPRPTLPQDAPKALIFSPHPDDECIVGGFPLRLMRQAAWRIVNVAVTQGSRPDRQEARFAELSRACEFLGFDLIPTAPKGLERVNPKTRQLEPDRWAEAVRIVAAILAQQAPRVIFVPHDADWNSTHIGTHWLVMDALARLPDTFACTVVETEFWGAMSSPNLMVESSDADVADLVGATSFHVGEVQRLPYHLLLPAWMQDNVRRGSELVGGQGGAAPDFAFATLYRCRGWHDGQLHAAYAGGRMLPCAADPLGPLRME
jgi:LmbE family N-acetylglucosaminyl deacetylase